MSISGKENEISGVILAGGENKRFKGRNKARIKIDGSPIISSALAVLEGIFDDIIIITNKPAELEEYKKFRMAPDKYLKVGPLGGIHSALRTTCRDAVFITACDMPLLSDSLIVSMVNKFKHSDCEVLIPQIDEFNEPLHAIYSKSVYDRLDNYLSHTNKYAIKDFLTLTRVEYMVIPDSKNGKRVFTNINTPADLDNFGDVEQ